MSQLWWIFLGVGALATALCQFSPVGLGQDVGYVLIGAAGVAAILVGVRLHRPIRRAPWFFMAAGQGLCVLADAAAAYQVDIANSEQFPAPADALYLAAYPVLAVGLVLLIRGRRPQRDVAGLLDSATLTVGLGLLSWVVLTGPTIETSQQSLFAAAVSLAYPAGDILLLGVMIRLITTPGGRTASLRLLLGAVAFLIGADTGASALGLLTFSSSASINFLWLMSYVLWGAAALHTSMTTLSEPTTAAATRFSRKRLAALTVAVLIAPGTLVVQLLTGSALDAWAVAVGSVAMFLLVVGRMNEAIREISTAHQQRTKAMDDLAYQAAHDHLTGLANRAQAMQLIFAALSRAQRSGSIIGLLFIDLDGFKAINDTHGHGAGDEVLRTTATRLKGAVRGGDVVARLGGDEFIVLLEPLDQTASAVEVADRLVSAVAAPITLSDGQHVALGASVGVAVSQDAGTDPDQLLHEADVAVYRAKAAGRGRTEVFDRALRHELQLQAELQSAIRHAIDRDELVLHYQPILTLATGAVEGYEALVRWDRPGLGLVFPDDFIPAAERTDLICDLDTWVLRHATSQLATWNRITSPAHLTMAVNISARHIGRKRIVDDINTAVTSSGIAPSQLVLEITETALIDDTAALTHLQVIRATGVRISLDDFGSGYNSVGRLEHLPVDIIKTDRRFLDPATPSAHKLLQLMVQSAHACDLPVIAEGVEHHHQLAILRALGCEFAQGYHLGRPTDQAPFTQGSLTSAPTLLQRTDAG